MIQFLAETPRGREMIEKFQRAYENLRKIVDRLQDENKKLREEFDEYRKRHPSTVGVKYSKPYAIREGSAPPDGGTSRRKRGAREGHKGHFRGNFSVPDPFFPPWIREEQQNLQEKCPYFSRTMDAMFSYWSIGSRLKIYSDLLRIHSSCMARFQRIREGLPACSPLTGEP